MKTTNEEYQPIVVCEVEITSEKLELLQTAIDCYGADQVYALIGKELVDKLTNV